MSAPILFDDARPSSQTATVYYDDTKLSFKDEIQAGVSAFPSHAKTYVSNLFPIIKWLPRYNLTWLTGDLIAGITIGCVVVPQGMAYAKLAALPVQYGLYSSFAGVFLYCFFATSKDITIGPTAVMSLLIGQILTGLTKSFPQYNSADIAATFSLFAGLITLILGLARLGFFINYISGPVIAGFMTGSALNIVISQLPTLFGLKNVNNRDSTYLVLGNSLSALPTSSIDAAFGLVGLFFLYLFLYGTRYIGRRFPKIERPMFFLGIARSILLVVISTLIAWGVSKNNPAKSPIKLNGPVPSGFQNVGIPKFDNGLFGAVATNFPVITLILIMEHVAIAKSFGRLNGYVISPSQEFVAIGISNVIGSFFSGYPATGSFSRTAIKSKAGVRTPLAGIFAGIVILLALYALTSAFYFIPNATLAAIIIHSVADLVSGPRIWKQYWAAKPKDLFVFVLGVVVIFFTTIEIGIYITVAFELVVLLFELARPRFSVLGRVPTSRDQKDSTHHIYVPYNHPSIRTTSPIEQSPPGVVVIRLQESFMFANASDTTDKIIETATALTRRGKPAETKNGDRAWNDEGLVETHKEDLPILKAIVVDFVAVSIFDTTSLHGLIAARSTLDRYADRAVEWHFANVTEAQIRNALIAGGFGKENPLPTGTVQVEDIEAASNPSSSSANGKEKESISPTKTYFHYDLDEAVRAAANASDY